MKRNIQLFQFIALLTFACSQLHSQVVSDFEANPSSGCAPLVVSFKNYSTQGDLVNYFWEFGNGETSIEKNPGMVYGSSGAYTVKLTVTGPGGTDISFKQIKVYKNPTANFIADNKGCVPFTTKFNDISTIGDVPINKWEWDFRTGAIDNRPNPEYTYSDTGKFDVFLRVTDGNGCTSDIDKTEYVDVVAPLEVQFSDNPPVACSTPATIKFISSATGAGTLIHHWEFGDQTSSSQKNPSKTYISFGSYPIKYKVNSEYNCPDSSFTTIEIGAVEAAGTLKQSGVEIKNGDIICPAVVQFQNKTTSSANVLWDFGDGTFSIDTAGSHLYTKSGPIEARLIVSPGSVCADTVFWNFTVDVLVASFAMDKDYSCSSPVLVALSDQSTNAVRWEWKVNNGVISTTKNTSYNFSLPPETDPYKINEEVSYTVNLKVENSRGCSSSTSKPFKINKPTAIFKIDTAYGCFPLLVNFKDTSISKETISSWHWIFNDGQTQTTSQNFTSHTYNNAGDFSAKLVITNTLGCIDTSYAVHIYTGRQISGLDFSVARTTVCPEENIQFSGTSIENSLIDGWHYFVDGMRVSALPTVSNPSWVVDADSGPLDVKLQVDYNGCITEKNKSGYLNNVGAVSDFSFDLDCDDPLLYTFTNKSQAAESFEWKFGDGASDASNINTTHRYVGENNYMVELTSIKGSCSHTLRKEIKARLTQAKIYGESIACANQPVTLYGDSSFNLVDFCHEQYRWDYQTGLKPILTKTDSVNLTFTKRGDYQVRLITYYDNSCIDSALHSIKIYEPYVGFIADTTSGCAPFDVTFTDTSKADINPLRKWEWKFGDGSPDLIYVNETNPIKHKFVNPGTFYAKLTVQDTLMCEGSQSIKISTANPYANFTILDPGVCLGSEVRFLRHYEDPDSVIWNFGDNMLSKDFDRVIGHTYNEKNDFQAALIVFKSGCSDTVQSLPGKIKIQEADARFSLSDTVYNCYPREIMLSHLTEGADVDKANSYWEFGYSDNLGPYNATVQFNYPVPGDYKAKLYINTTYGCKDTAEQIIKITGPTGIFTLSDNTPCLEDLLLFTLTNASKVYDFEWYTGDGKILKGNPLKYKYDQVGEYLPKLVLYGDSGKCIPPPIEDTITIDTIIADFSFADTALCGGYSIQFYNNSSNNVENQWNFGNGNFSSDIEPVNQFDAGTYSVELIVKNSNACSDSITRALQIVAIPDIIVSKDTLICLGGEALLSVQGGTSVLWSPIDGLSSSVSYTPKAKPSSSVLYTATVLDEASNCRNSDNVEVLVQQQPFASMIPAEDTTVRVGEYIYILVDSVGGNTYLWSPDYQLSCIECANTTARPLTTTDYTLAVSDSNMCFTIYKDLHIEVIERYDIQMPTSIRPLGSENNQVVYVKGSGIDYLIEFRVFNRWGNEVFFTDDMNKGWDGTLNGNVLGIDSYGYIIRAMMLDGTEQIKKGTINLIK